MADSSWYTLCILLHVQPQYPKCIIDTLLIVSPVTFTSYLYNCFVGILTCLSMYETLLVLLLKLLDNSPVGPKHVGAGLEN